MEADKQRGSIVLTKQNIDGQDYIRIDYGNNQAIALLLSEDSGIKIAGNGSAYIQASAFRLPAFYDRYSPHGKSSVRCPLKPSDSIPLCPNNPAH